MKKFNKYQFEIKPSKTWIYTIYDLEGKILFTSYDDFCTKSTAEYAAIGHITLLEKENTGEKDD